MIIVFLGPPGSGKGTQSSILCKKFNLKKISTGDIFRELSVQDTALAREVTQVMSSGGLIDDNLVTKVLIDHLETKNLQDHYLLDGFPRTLKQALYYDKYLVEKNKTITKAFFLDVPESLLVNRVSSRITCSNCGEVFNINQNIKQCSNCGSEQLSIRKDDNIEIVQKRIENYKAQTLPIIDFYHNRNLLVTIDGSLPINIVTEEIISHISFV
ncbi:adenylate kinase family protein [Rickettsiales endosymbiont of Stachyamoeba lipophora]|uniref:adenylate kinase family protein n=1 Tax=Rickettsiales endosymbiont of Stachyamoeba lipophora TaxID=2486578 RepID=UPI000F64DB3F|nr:nucleoside monophosphate kinase [Rickettsiales endosymbiont of Stachyamoeba lipophora]AZL15885.1 nucleoside monophosphate kinase [Rickettsiales endosymbiont of Stachyamoeba lipophora]